MVPFPQAKGDRLPTTQSGSGKKQTDKKQVDKKQADKKPTDKKPTEKKPADKKLADKKPADKKPADKKPAEKKPADKKTGNGILVEAKIRQQNIILVQQFLSSFHWNRTYTEIFVKLRLVMGVPTFV